MIRNGLSEVSLGRFFTGKSDGTRILHVYIRNECRAQVLTTKVRVIRPESELRLAGLSKIDYSGKP